MQRSSEKIGSALLAIYSWVSSKSPTAINAFSLKHFFLTVLINGELCNEAYEESFERVIHIETIFTIEKRKLWY